MSEGLQPSGIPLSRALIIRPGIANDELREAVAAINRVHGDGDLPEVPVALVSSITGPAGEADGRFVFQPAAGGPAEPHMILVRSGAPHRQFVLAYEVGHLIDLCGLPGVDFASGLPGVRELEEWRQAVVASRTVASLDGGRIAGENDNARSWSIRSFDELWACSYAQFIASRSGSVALRRALDEIRVQHGDAVYYPLQWPDDDCVAIDRAIREVFRRLGWMSPR